MIEQLWQHWCVTHIAGGDFDSANFQRFLVDANVYLAPNPAFRAAMLAGVPRAFTFGFAGQPGQEKINIFLADALSHCENLDIPTTARTTNIAPKAKPMY